MHKLTRRLMAALLLSCSGAAMACQDSMAFAADKQKHFAASMAIGAGARLLTDDTTLAFSAGLGIGLLKELADARSRTGCASVQDLAYDALGTALGVYGTHWIIRHNFIGYRTVF